jgi:hypothetical protein
MSDRSTNAVQGVRRAHRHAGPLPATTIVAAVALAAVAGRALELRRRRVAVPSA